MEPTKVLAVDDSDLMHRMYEVMLRGVEVLHARDGVQALDLLTAHPDIDLVLLDINMPNMNGFELLAELGRRGRVPSLAVVVVTTEGHEDEAARGLAAGATAYLTKPFRGDQVRAAIAAIPTAGAAPELS